MFKTILSVASLAAVAMAAPEAVPNEWIVQLDTGVSAADVAAHLDATGLDKDDIMDVWSMGDFQGYAFRASDNARLMVAEMPQVMSVSPNWIAHASQSCAAFNPSSWGIRRVNQRNLPLPTGVRIQNGAGSVGYCLDTGINISHNSFGGRATHGANFSSSPGNTDPNGHGTHVAGTMVGAGFGIATGGRVINVKVLGDNGSGSYAGIISGVNWANNNCPNRSCIANLSLGGPSDNTLNNAVNSANNLLVVAAAGNSGGVNACNSSPAGARDAFTVASTTTNDSRSSFSDIGTCVDIFAPGSSIVSASGSNSGTRSLSGTSMAAPHVAGIAQVIAAQNPTFSPAQIGARLVSDAVTGVVGNPGNGSPNRLAQVPAC